MRLIPLLSVSLAGCAVGGLTGAPGQFADESHRLPTGGLSTTDVQMLDLDADGDLDLVWASQNFGELIDEAAGVWELPGYVQVSLNNGDATFYEGEIPTDFGAWTFVETSDIDADGDPDLVMTRPARTKSQVGLLLNDGSGRFTASPFPEVLGNDVGLTFSRATATDIDMDGDPDLVLPVMLAADLEGQPPSNLLFVNDGAASFSLDSSGRLPPTAADTDYTLSIAAADFDSDGDPDLVYGNAERQSRLLANDGSGFFTDATMAPSGEARIPTAMARAYRALPYDVDDDGDQDLVVANDAAPTREGGIVSFGNYVLPNDGAGNFGLISLPGEPLDTRGIAVADVNGDGVNDVVVGNSTGGVVPHGGEAISVWLGDGAGGYAPMPAVPRFVGGVFGVAVGDLDGNGKADIAAAVGTGDDTATVSGDFSDILLLSR